MRRHAKALAVLAATFGLAACSSGGGSGDFARPVAVSAGFSTTECGTYSGRGCARDSDRVDLVRPTFSHPTRITNPMYPMSQLRSVVLLGHVGRKRFRTETTLLPGSQAVVWAGLPSQENGNALVDVLYGLVTPFSVYSTIGSAKLG